MVENYVSAIKASFVLYELPYVVFNHPKIKYFIKSLKTNRPLTLRPHNLIDLIILRRISIACLDLPHGLVYRAVFLTGFFAFMRLFNLAPHSLSTFDPSRHLTGHDVFFTKTFVKILTNGLKPSKLEIKSNVSHFLNYMIMTFALSGLSKNSFLFILCLLTLPCFNYLPLGVRVLSLTPGFVKL